MNKYNAIFILVTALLTSGANGISLSVSEGNEDSASGATTIYGAEIDDVVEHNINLDPSENEISNYLYFSGPGWASRWAYGDYGGYADAGFTISGAQAQTWYDFYSNTYPNAVVSEYFTSVNAASIYGWASAKSDQGDFVYADISVNSPYNGASLYGYNGASYASSIEAYVSQSANGASAPYGSITASEYANNRWGDTSYAVSYDMSDLHSPYPYYIGYPAQAWANSQYSAAGQSIPGNGRPMKAYAQANIAGYFPISDYKQASGSHAYNQLAYTYRPTLYQYAYNTPIY